MRRLLLMLCVLVSLGLAGVPASAAEPVDWSDHLAARVELGGGWHLEGCLRMDLSLCAYGPDGALAGTVILAVYDLWPHEDASAEGMHEHVAEFHEVLREDRLATCGDGFAYDADPLTHVPFAGRDGYRFGFTLTDAEGVVNEHVVIFTTFASGMRFVLNTNFVQPEGCPGEDHERDELGPALTTGTGGDRYDPAGLVTRGQAASLLARLLEVLGEELPESHDQGFTDIAGNVHAERINQLAGIGVLRGASATTFEPHRPLSRAQAAALAARVHQLALDRDLYDEGIAFPDVDGVHAPSISRAATAGLVHGTADGLFAPGELVRRDQFATMATRTLNRVSWSRWIAPPPDGDGGDPGQPKG